jgi:hypothetical protein
VTASREVILSAGPYRSRLSGARKDDKLLGRAGHRDIAVDAPFDACSDGGFSKRFWVDEDDEVELEALRVFRGQRPDGDLALNVSC